MMDGSSVEHSDSDSGESWILLENNSHYADEAPELSVDQERQVKQPQENDEDTDGISIISDSDHDAPTPLPDVSLYDKCEVNEELPLSEDISTFVSVDPLLSNIHTDNDQEPNEAFLGDSHMKLKTYVHRRNKRLSAVLNIIVLGSVITAAGVAIGHMWGAKNDCSMQPTPSVNKILSNLYKLQEENAYLRRKLKELTVISNYQMQQQKVPHKQNKCKKRFEESLSKLEPKKLTKCVDEWTNSVDNIVEHLTEPNYEKEFIADIDTLKSVYLQNKNWLDDEISRRLKIEEELHKKYKDELKSVQEQKKKSESTTVLFSVPDIEVTANDKIRILEKDVPMFEKVTYTDSLKSSEKPSVDLDEEQSEIDEIILELVGNTHQTLEEEEKLNSNTNVDIFEEFYPSDWLSNEEIEQILRADKEKNFSENKPIFRRNEERYATNEDNNWLKNAQEPKNTYENEKHEILKNENKQKRDIKSNYHSMDKMMEFSVSEEDIKKDDRYIINKDKQDKKKGEHHNFNKKQKRKNKHNQSKVKVDSNDEQDFISNNSDKNRVFVNTAFLDESDDSAKSTRKYKDRKNKGNDILEKEKKNQRRGDTAEKEVNWLEKRAVLRTEARKRYYEQFGESSPNNASWYFRRMRKREQCRAKGENSTFKKINNQKKGRNTKH